MSFFVRYGFFLIIIDNCIDCESNTYLVLMLSLQIIFILNHLLLVCICLAFVSRNTCISKTFWRQSVLNDLSRVATTIAPHNLGRETVRTWQKRRLRTDEVAQTRRPFRSSVQVRVSSNKKREHSLLACIDSNIFLLIAGRSAYWRSASVLSGQVLHALEEMWKFGVLIIDALSLQGKEVYRLRVM